MTEQSGHSGILFMKTFYNVVNYIIFSVVQEKRMEEGDSIVLQLRFLTQSACQCDVTQ